MTEKIIAVKLFQPFVQFRNPLTHKFAQTYPLPPPATIRGFLQCALNREYDSKVYDVQLSIHGGYKTIVWSYQWKIGNTPYLDLETHSLIVDHKKSKSKKTYKTVMYKTRPLKKGYIKYVPCPTKEQELVFGTLFLFIKGPKDIIDEIYDRLEKPHCILALGRGEDEVYIEGLYKIKEFETKTENEDLSFFYNTFVKYDVSVFKDQKFPIYNLPLTSIFKNNGFPVKNKSEINRKTKREQKRITISHIRDNRTILLKKQIKYDEIKFPGEKFAFRIIRDLGWL